MAPGWERWRAQLVDAQTPVREWLIGALEPQLGEVVLELGAGTGETGFGAAASLGKDGRLISSDFSPSMVEAARRRGSELGLSGTSTTGSSTPSGSSSTQARSTACSARSPTCWRPTRPRPRRDRRVLRPGGRLALSVWGAPEHNPWVSIAGMILVERGHMPAPAPGAPGVFSLASEERTRTLLDGAGFRSVCTEEVPVRFAFRDLDDYEQWLIDLAGPVRDIGARAPRR